MAYRMVPAENKQCLLDIGEEVFGSELDDEVWDEVLQQIDKQRPISGVTKIDVEIEEKSHPGDAATTQLLSLCHARLPEYARGGIPDLEDVMEDIRVLRQRLPAQMGEHESDAAYGIEGTSAFRMTASRKKDETSSTSSLTEKQEIVRIEAEADHAKTTTASSADHAGDGSPDADVKFRRSPGPRQPEDDFRSPLERFRSPPKKTLSVTDLVSPAWCELQYWYSLTKFGRVRQTPIMKQGSKIHKEKEREVHTEVEVNAESAEDHFGMRLWNMIAGLRTLRETGLTRELGVIGMIDGEVINGVIDELSYTCPDEDKGADIYRAAEALRDDTASSAKKKKSKKSGVSEEMTSQRTLADFFANPTTVSSTNEDEPQSGFGSNSDDRRSIYLVDIKTRKARGLPSNTQMRPTRMQLMLYHRLLTDMAHGEVEADRVFQRYRLDKDSLFSDAFIASMTNLDAGSGYGQSSEDDDESPDDPMTSILAHNTLIKLWTFMISEFSKTLTASPVSPLLWVEYRASASGDVISKVPFALDAIELNSYVASEMQWWRGERPARGVEVEEASKCRICEFAESCSWRKAKVAEVATSARSKKATRANNAPVV